MFQIHSHSPAVAVSVDGSSGRPLEVRAAGKRLTVTALEAVRDETAAYPLDSGPRTVFVIRADGQRYRLVHLIRDRSWTLEELDTRGSGLASAA